MMYELAVGFPTIKPEILIQPFSLGLELGLFCAALALWRLMTVKLDLRRFKQHLSDRIELEADSVKKAKGELETLRRENEQLRIRVQAFNERADWKAPRDLEVYARAEKRMFVNVPGFAAAWENAKSEALSELQAEDSGQSLPKRVFSRLFGSSNHSANPVREALPAPNGSR